MGATRFRLRPQAGTEFGLQVSSAIKRFRGFANVCLRARKAHQTPKMGKYAFLRSSASLAIIGLLLGLIGGFKIANSQYRSQQSAALNRDIARATSGMSGSQADVSAIIQKAKANPNDAEAQLDAAIQYIQIERPQEALPFLEQARKSASNDPRVSAAFGIAYFMLRQYDQAIESLRRAREQGANDLNVTSLLLGAYIETGKNLDEADQLLKELEGKEIDPAKLARIRQDLNAARAGSSGGAGVASGSKTTLSHGPQEPQVKPSPSGEKLGGKN
jgi:tetratricopeptide (TPR) repeat protein